MSGSNEQGQGMPTDQAELLQKFMGQRQQAAGPMTQGPGSMPQGLSAQMGGAQTNMRQQMPRPAFQRPQDEMPAKQGR